MQYIPCNSAFLAQEALFLLKKALFMPKDLQKKVRKSRQILIRNKIAYMFGLKIFVRVQTFRRVSPVLPCNFCHPGADGVVFFLGHPVSKCELHQKSTIMGAPASFWDKVWNESSEKGYANVAACS